MAIIEFGIEQQLDELREQLKSFSKDINRSIGDTHYLAIFFPSGFYQVLPDTDDAPTDLHTSWKLHIAVNPEKLQAAWEIIVDIMIRQDRFFPFKVGYDRASAEVLPIPGRDITIYLSAEVLSTDEGLNALQTLIEEIEESLFAARIEPYEGPIPPADRGLSQCDYISYRHDHYNGKYLKQTEAFYKAHELGSKPYNPYGFDDPLMNIIYTPSPMLSTSTASTDNVDQQDGADELDDMPSMGEGREHN